LTVDYQGLRFRVSYCTGGAHKVRESGKPDFPTGEREIAKKCTVGKRLPRESEELLTLRATLLKVLVRAAVPSRAACVRVVSELERSSLCSDNREKQISPCRPEERGNLLIVKTGMPEEGVGQQVMLRWSER